MKGVVLVKGRLDLHKVIRSLLEEKRQLESVIASLESLEKSGAIGAIEGTAQGTQRRGRRDMPLDERRLVSERMKRYWLKRKASQGANGLSQPEPNLVTTADKIPEASNASVTPDKWSRKRR